MKFITIILLLGLTNSASAAVILFRLDGQFTTSSLNGAFFLWEFKIDENKAAHSTGSSTGFASSVYVPATVGLTITGSASDDGNYSPVNSNSVRIIIQENDTGPDNISLNSGGTPNFILPTFGGLGLSFFASVDDGVVQGTSLTNLSTPLATSNAGSINYFPNVDATVADFSVQRIPEPSGIFLLAVAMFSLLTVKRRA